MNRSRRNAAEKLNGNKMRIKLVRRLSAITLGAILAMTLLSVAAAASQSGWIYRDAVMSAPPIDLTRGFAPIQARKRVDEACPKGIPRSTNDRPDTREGWQVHIVYLVAKDFSDELLDTKGLVNCSVLAWSGWFAEQSSGLEWRLDTFRPSGSERDIVDVTFVRASVPGTELVDTTDIEDQLREAGLADSRKLYFTYVAADGGSLCGRGRYPLASTGENGTFGGHGRFAYLYLFGAAGCHGHEFGSPGRPLWMEATVMQELLHTEGVVPLGAPRGCSTTDPVPTHVCTGGVPVTTMAGLEVDPERIDVMFPFVTLPLAEKVLDRDKDDYFNHSLPLRDLSESPFLIKN